MRSLSKPILLLCLLLCAFPGLAQTGLHTDTSLYKEETAVYSSDSTLAQSGAVEDEDTEKETYLPPRNATLPSAARWDSLTTDKDFGYKDAREVNPVKPEDVKPPKIPAWFRALAKFFRFFTTTTGQIVLWSALALLVGFIVYKLISGEGGFFSKKVQPLSNATTSEAPSSEDLLLGDWEEKMQAAMQSRDYRLAIRYGYLLMLQLLQRRELILYRQDKTNTDYYRELANTRESLRPDFRAMTRAYEWAWYGGRPATQQEAETYFNTFNGLKSGLQ